MQVSKYFNPLFKIEDFNIFEWVSCWFNEYCESFLEREKNDLKDLYEDLHQTDVGIFADECLIDLAVEFGLDEDDVEPYRDNVEYDLENIIDETILSIEQMIEDGLPEVNMMKNRNSYIMQLEARVRKLENRIKNEFLDVLNKPKRSEEKEWASKLFTKFPSLRRELDNAMPIDSASEKKTFQLVLKTRDKKYNGMCFIITTDNDRSDMCCVAVDGADNKIASLDKFHLDNDLNKCAMFIMQTLKSSANENKRTKSKSRKYENVPLTTFDCETLLQIMEDNFDDLPEIGVDITDDNADYGFVSVGIYRDDEYLTSYDVIVNDVNSVDVECDNKKIGTSKSLEDAADMLADSFMEDYINGKYNKEKK